MWEKQRCFWLENNCHRQDLFYTRHSYQGMLCREYRFSMCATYDRRRRHLHTPHTVDQWKQKESASLRSRRRRRKWIEKMRRADNWRRRFSFWILLLLFVSVCCCACKHAAAAAAPDSDPLLPRVHSTRGWFSSFSYLELNRNHLHVVDWSYYLNFVDFHQSA